MTLVLSVARNVLDKSLRKVYCGIINFFHRESRKSDVKIRYVFFEQDYVFFHT